MKKCYALCATLFSIVFSCSIYAQSWQPVGPNDSNQATFFGQSFISMAVGSNGTPYIVFLENHVIEVKKFEGGVWTLIGTPGFSSAVAYDPHIAIDGNNIPYVVYRDAGNSNKATVQKSKQLNVGAGSTSLSLDMSNLSKKVYFLTIKSSSVSKQIELLKR